ncbi:MAG: sigma-70 family RNA polymerase sigma factor [Planctomycetaceae bacterium]|nr:sigma-70 family RNA polymerase sigma factor [Planctomycetaceae bacterium]
MNEEALEKLRQLDWKEISANLLLAASTFAVRYGWHLQSALPNGQSLRGVVQETISDIWESPERLNPDVPLPVQLAGIVRSKLYNLAKSPDDDVVRTGDLPVLDTASATKSPLEETARLFNRAMELLAESPRVKGNDDRELVVMAMAEGALAVRDIAETTGLSEARIYQVTREIRAFYPTIGEQLRREEC